MPNKATLTLIITGAFAAILAACATDKAPATAAAPAAPPPAPVVAAVAPMTPTAPTVAATPVDFHAKVQPFFEQYCYDCHGPDEQKHQIRFDSRAAAMASRNLILPGNAARSGLARVLSLPPRSEEHMPPADRKQPTPEEIAMIRQWITEGANWPVSGTGG